MDITPETENTPLLLDRERPTSPETEPQDPVAPSAFGRVRRHLQKWATLYLCGLFIFVVDVPGFMGEAVRVRMYELSICRDYYSRIDPGVIGPGGDVPENLCKGEHVQSDLAKLRGFQNLLDQIQGKFIHCLILRAPWQ
jgi:hypothetical protein